MTQMTPDVTIAADSVAQEHRRRTASLPPRLVKQGTAIARSDGVPPRRRHPPSPLLGDLFLVFLAGELVHGGVFHDLLARDLPSFLDDPRQRPILPGRFVLDFLEHVFRKVQGLLAFIRAGHTRDSFEDRLHGVKTSAGVWRRIFQMGKGNYGLDARDLIRRNALIRYLRCFARPLGVVIHPARHYPIALFNHPSVWL